jgi:hypothetical protein
MTTYQINEDSLKALRASARNILTQINEDRMNRRDVGLEAAAILTLTEHLKPTDDRASS